MSTRPQQGHFVRVRSRLYLVDSVSDVAAEKDAVVHLSCLDEDAPAYRSFGRDGQGRGGGLKEAANRGTRCDITPLARNDVIKPAA
ncbi:MAG TPA: hypothetical protein VN894_10370 [Polyangiaceae bacterium]|nr:hypothetical protein [Polyangiaceae bacterium]